jgi:hypothetical protein
MKQTVFFATTVLALCAIGSSSAATSESQPGSMTFSDGAIATAYDHCGDADLCAKIKYRDGDALLFFSEGAALNQPYVIHVVRTRQKVTMFEYSRRFENWGTVLTLDHGLAQLRAYLNKDGTLRFSFVSATTGK